MIKQHTIKDIVSFSGLGVHTGNKVNITLKPLPVNSGIIVNRIDKNYSFKVSAAKIVANTRNTTLGENNVNVQTIEHFMFAFYYFKITNIEIQINNEEFPIFDGSAKTIIEEINSVGVLEQSDTIKEIIVDKRYEISNQNSIVIIEPSDKFELDLTIDFPTKEIGIYNYKYQKCNSLRDISTARTFVMLSELELLINSGLSQIDDIECAHLVKNIKPSDKFISNISKKFNITKNDVLYKLNELERLSLGEENFIPKRLAEHKVLDFLGDMYLTTSCIKGKITITKPGHLINGQVAQLLAKI